ncbi:MAG: hypothetical protein EZS28_003022 [Streblomastix strix]|uniref:Uncharacterized protein n=1 Tax=Streblomastix strix TaxID=222440 RepID=A0A5J4X3Z0_9EUKA|nr:MAG: hypothetical protein EZS28_003022 [Streblomastix strix]
MKTTTANYQQIHPSEKIFRTQIPAQPSKSISSLSHLSLWHPSYKVRLIQFLIKQLYPYFHIGLLGCIYLAVITLWVAIGPVFIGFGGLKKELVFVFSWGVSYGNRMFAREGMYTTFCLEAMYYGGILLSAILAHTDRLKLNSKQEKKKKIKVVKNKNKKLSENKNDQNIAKEKHSVQSPFFFSQMKTSRFSSYLPRVRDTRCALDKLSIIIMFYYYYKGYIEAV